MRHDKKSSGFGLDLNINRARGVLMGAMSLMMLGGIGMPATAGDGDCVVPTLVGSHEMSSFTPTAVAVEGTVVYATMINGAMDIFDVSDPTDPVFLSTYGVDVPGPYVLTYDLAVSNQMAYLAINGFNFKGIRVADVSQPEAPFGVGVIEVGENINLAATANTLITQFDLSDPMGFRAFNMSNPSSPSLIGSFVTPGDMHDITTDGERVYISDGAFGLEILDASDAGVLDFLGLYSAPGFVAGLTAVGDGVAYAVSNGTLNAIDVSDPASASLLGVVDLGSSPTKVPVVGSTVYLLFNDLEELRILDASDPASIVQIGTYDTHGSKIDMAAEGNTVYLLGGDLQIIDVTNTCDILCDNPADMNSDCALNFFDISIWLHAFAHGDPVADFNGDGLFSNFDLSMFLGLFQQGCS